MKTKQYQKKKQSNILILLGLILIGILVILLYPQPTIIDYTKLPDEEVFMKRVQDITNQKKQRNAEGQNYCIFEVVDEQNQPIKDSQIQLYNGRFPIVTLTTNKEGIASVSDLQKEEYAFQQLSSKKGYHILDKNYYKIELDDGICHFKIKNNKENTELTTYEKEPIFFTSVSKEENDIRKVKENWYEDYTFLKEDLRGETMSVYALEEKTEGGKIQKDYQVTITNATIQSIDIKWEEKQENQKLVNVKGKETTHFENGKGFSLVSDEKNGLSEAKVKMTIIFEKEGKRYKVAKEITLGKKIDSYGSATIINATEQNLDYQIYNAEEETEVEFENASGWIESQKGTRIDNMETGIYRIDAYKNGQRIGFYYFAIEQGKDTEIKFN